MSFPFFVDSKMKSWLELQTQDNGLQPTVIIKNSLNDFIKIHDPGTCEILEQEGERTHKVMIHFNNEQLRKLKKIAKTWKTNRTNLITTAIYTPINESNNTKEQL